MTERIDPELLAIKAVAGALEPLDVAQRERVLRWAGERFRLNLYTIIAEGQEELRAKEGADV